MATKQWRCPFCDKPLGDIGDDGYLRVEAYIIPMMWLAQCPICDTPYRPFLRFNWKDGLEDTDKK